MKTTKTYSGDAPPQISIHPVRQPRERLERKRRNHQTNLLNRAETNRGRSNDPKGRPTWHGIGRHAGVAIGH